MVSVTMEQCMSPRNKLRLAALAVLAPVSLMLAPLPAYAVNVTFSGGASGTDPLGGNYTAGPNTAGFATWGEAPYNNGGGQITFNPTGLVSDGSANANAFIFTYTGSQPNAFNKAF